MTEINFGRIFAEIESNQVVVFQANESFKKEIRRYDKIPKRVCEICLLPEINCNKHEFFINDKEERILSNLFVACFYKKNPFNRMSSELAILRKSKDLTKNSLLFIIFKEILKTIIQKSNEKFDLVVNPPSKYDIIKRITKQATNELGVQYKMAEDLIIYNKSLHKSQKIRKQKSMAKIKALINKIFKENPSLSLDFQNILLVDDIIRTGATINSIAMLLKKQGIKRVSGFAWLRAIEV